MAHQDSQIALLRGQIVTLQSQQQRHLRGYLADAVVAYRLGQSAPVLLTGRKV